MTLRKILYILIAAACLFWPAISSPIALALGLLVGVILTNPYLSSTKSMTSKLLQVAVVGLGAGMNLTIVAKVGVQGFAYTFISIAITLILGVAIGRWLKVLPHTSMLITVGTAICGGSAIASVAPVLKAKQHEISIALGIVFILNSVALFLFPHIGHFFAMSQEQFGLWCALAIHDTSSVVGASIAYGAEALQIGTTVKLARALWIVPVTFAVGLYAARFMKTDSPVEGKRNYPWFILGFLLMAALATWIPQLQQLWHSLEFAARRLLILTLFIIGSNLNKDILRSMGFRPISQGLILWLLAASGSLFAILMNWIHL